MASTTTFTVGKRLPHGKWPVVMTTVVVCSEHDTVDEAAQECSHLAAALHGRKGDGGDDTDGE